jgi:hypothetical protein
MWRLMDAVAGELLCPVLVCTVCGRPVSADDNVVYDGLAVEPEIRVAHKGACDLRYQREHPGSWWRPVRELVKQLAHNLEQPDAGMRRSLNGGRAS